MTDKAINTINRWLPLLGTIAAVIIAYSTFSERITLMERKVDAIYHFICQDRPKDFGCTISSNRTGK